MKETLLDFLEKCEAENKVFTVKWDAGGDQTIITYFLNENELSYDSNDILGELSQYLIQEFDLPGVGEYYNEGGGLFVLEEKEKILFKYDEFAYGEIYDKEVTSEIRLDEFSILLNSKLKDLLGDSLSNSIKFYGSTTFLPNERDNFFELSNAELDEILQEQVKKEIKKYVIPKFDPPYDGTEIGYSGKISSKEIVIEELFQLKYWVDKNKKNEKLYLFE